MAGGSAILMDRREGARRSRGAKNRCEVNGIGSQGGSAGFHRTDTEKAPSGTNTETTVVVLRRGVAPVRRPREGGVAAEAGASDHVEARSRRVAKAVARISRITVILAE